jgi:hypothetical protein
MFYWCYFYLFTNNGVQHYFHIRWCSYSSTVTRWVTLVEQELPTLPKHQSSPPDVYWGYCCSIFSVLDLFVLFTFGHCIVCPSSIYSFWLPLSYLQAFHRIKIVSKKFPEVNSFPILIVCFYQKKQKCM